MSGPGMGRGGMRGMLEEMVNPSKPEISWPLIKRILSYLKPYVFQFIMVFAAILLSVAGVFLVYRVRRAQGDSRVISPGNGAS